MLLASSEAATFRAGGHAFRAVTFLDGNGAVLVSAEGPEALEEPPAPVLRRGEVAWYVPYTTVHPRTVAGVPADAVWLDVSSSPFSYYGALRGIWERGETFAVLEHDVVCRPDVVEVFEQCPEPWCCYGYSDICHRECMEAWRNLLGCTRFRSELIETVPDLLAQVQPAGWDWHNLCDEVGNRLRDAGFTHHWHEPWVEHHHMGRHD